MGQLVLVVLAAAWAAVLVPPLLRARIENRPNSSVTDFRRQLNKLQSTVPNRAAGGQMRGMARPLAPSPLQRPAAPGRPGQRQAASLRRAPAGARSHSSAATATREMPRRRTHGDPTGGQPRPAQRRHAAQVATREPVNQADMIRRRRMNVLFMLALGTAASLFLAATTKEPAFLYLFALAFLATFGYLYMLAQVRQREQSTWGNDWLTR